MSDEAAVGERGTIEIVPEGRRIRGTAGATILHVLQEGGVPIGSSCGGKGICGECRIRFVDSSPAPTSSDRERLSHGEIEAGWRLACMHALDGEARIEVPAVSGELDHKASGDEGAPAGPLNPAVRARVVCPGAPSRDDPRPLVERFRAALGGDIRVPLPVVRRLVDLSGNAGELTAIEAAGEILDVQVGPAASVHGLAIDVGTTTLAVYLFELATGRQVGAAASRNPQRRFGADVIARIAHVRRHEGEGLVALHTATIDGLNGLIERVTAEASVPRSSIYRATVVGNPTMIHLLLSVDPRGIDVSPYVAAFDRGVRCRAEDIGLAIHPRGVVETLPAISAYVGADIVAGILATGLQSETETTVFLDVGTNGEIVLAAGGRLIACSTAAGPAFEGASIVQGMPALDGAIESVSVRRGRVDCTTIGDAPPIGLCGTGLVAAVAELRSAGVIDRSGRFSDAGSPLRERLEGTGKARRFRLTDGDTPVYLYQGDVREFQLAKAAVRAGIEIQLRHAELTGERLDRVLIGGAFSARVSNVHLIGTGFVPAVDPSCIRVVGNTAGQGAKRVLLDRSLAEEAERVAGSVEYLELSSDQRFADLYVEQMAFPGDG